MDLIFLVSGMSHVFAAENVIVEEDVLQAEEVLQEVEEEEDAQVLQKLWYLRLFSMVQIT